jgi:hypothetical protein
MLMDCERRCSWSLEQELERYFNGRLSLNDFVNLRTEPPGTVGMLDEKWNSLNKLTTETRLLHLTRPSTQPWLTGLPMDDRIFDPTQPLPNQAGPDGEPGELPRRYYIENTDEDQVRAFFDLLGECIGGGMIDPAWVRHEIAEGRVRPDLFDVLEGYGYRPGRLQQRTLEMEYFGSVCTQRSEQALRHQHQGSLSKEA